MKTQTQVALIIGSLREESINRQFAEYIVSQLPDYISVEEISIANLPLYNQDYDKQQIDSYDKVRYQIKKADAVLIVTPEHNRSMPSALKNVIDIASRPHGDSAWTNKKVAVVTASPGTYGGRSSGLDVRKVMQSLAVQMMVTPEVYLAHATDSLDDQGVSSNRTQQFLTKFANEFATFIGA